MGGDLIKGARNASAIGVMVERTTLLVMLARLDDTTAPEVREAFQRRLKRIPEPLRKSLTYDQGKEMAEHEKLARNLKINVYFADPHSPWQRGICKNTKIKVLHLELECATKYHISQKPILI